MNAVGPSSTGHHKDVDQGYNALLHLYYTNKVFMGFCCVGAEFFYVFL